MEERKIIDTIKKVMPAVVSIAISRHLEAVERENVADIYPFFPAGHGKKQKGAPEEKAGGGGGMIEIGGGSGFIVDPKGLILTNRHVVGGKDEAYIVITDSGEKLPATIVSCDPINDVAILKVEPPGGMLPALELGDASTLQLGETVLAIGNALGIFRNTVSAGIVSGLSRSISAKSDTKSPPQELRGLIQTDAAINPGNSGGPLVDMSGKAVGINVAVVFGAQSIGFAIPAQAALRDLKEIKTHGRVRRPYLGIRYVILDENLKARKNLPVDYGALITKEGPEAEGIIAGSPAEKAGLRERDIILECNGKTIDANYTVDDVLEAFAVGDALNLRLLRSGKEMTIAVKLEERKR
jgi:serine protease Do